MENTQDYQDYQDYRAEILGIVRSNASPGIMRNKLEDYHENDLADVFPDLRCRAAEIVPDSESGHACGYLRVYR